MHNHASEKNIFNKMNDDDVSIAKKYIFALSKF